MMEEKSRWLYEAWEKYLAGTASREELAQLQEYLQQERRPELEQLFREQQDGSETMPEDMAAHLRLILTDASAPQPVVRKLNKQAARWSAAAILLLAMAGSYLLLRNKRQEAGSEVAITLYDSVVNKSLQARFIQLPDATKVWLNKGAKLYISKTYTAQRQLKLNGEAYFDVTGNASTPLVVQTGTTSTTVLGTGFNIDYTNGKVAVSLVQGKVQVAKENAATPPVLLSPGETALTGEEAKYITHDRTGVTDVAAWIKGHLVFNQVPLSDALTKAAAYYGVVIKADQALLQGKIVNTTYYKHQDWQQVLHHLLFMYRLKYSLNAQHEIVVTPQ